MRYCAALLALGLAAIWAGSALSSPPPKPSVVPVSWELEFIYQAPQTILLRLPGEAKAQRYWYMLYTVVNRTKADQVFVPEFTLYTDTGKVHRAGDGIPAAVFDAIQRRHNNPLLLDSASIIGKILQGEDNAKDGVAIWPDIDHDARNFDIFIAGISGERAVVPLPASGPADDAVQPGQSKGQAVLAKTMQLNYTLPGEAAARERTVPRLNSQEWVMR